MTELLKPIKRRTIHARYITRNLVVTLIPASQDDRINQRDAEELIEIREAGRRSGYRGTVRDVFLALGERKRRGRPARGKVADFCGV